jgi:hypothetical protein
MKYAFYSEFVLSVFYSSLSDMKIKISRIFYLLFFVHFETVSSTNTGKYIRKLISYGSITTTKLMIAAKINFSFEQSYLHSNNSLNYHVYTA